MKNWIKKTKDDSRKIVGKFLYYAISTDPTMLLALNSLATVHTKPTNETKKNSF